MAPSGRVVTRRTPTAPTRFAPCPRTSSTNCSSRRRRKRVPGVVRRPARNARWAALCPRACARRRPARGRDGAAAQDGIVGVGRHPRFPQRSSRPWWCPTRRPSATRTASCTPIPRAARSAPRMKRSVRHGVRAQAAQEASLFLAGRLCLDAGKARGNHADRTEEVTAPRVVPSSACCAGKRRGLTRSSATMRRKRKHTRKRRAPRQASSRS